MSLITLNIEICSVLGVYVDTFQGQVPTTNGGTINFDLDNQGAALHFLKEGAANIEITSIILDNSNFTISQSFPFTVSSENIIPITISGVAPISSVVTIVHNAANIPSPYSFTLQDLI